MINNLTRQYRAVIVVTYNESWNNEPYKYQRTTEQYYTCSDAREAAKQFLHYLQNHCGIKATDKHIDIYVVATGEKVSYDDFKG